MIKNKRWIAFGAVLFTVASILDAWATVTTYKFVDQASNTFNIQLFQCIGTPVYCTAMVLEDSSGNEKFTSGNPGNVAAASGSIASGAVASGAFASGSLATGAGTDGWNVTEGTKADSAWSSGSGSVIAILKAIATAVTSAVPLGTSNGVTPKILNALSNSAVSVKGSAGQLFGLQCGNTNASEEYVQIYNVASGSVTVGSTSPTLSVPIAATATGGLMISLVGIQFGTAISVAATTTATGGSAPGTALDCNAFYN